MSLTIVVSEDGSDMQPNHVEALNPTVILISNKCVCVCVCVCVVCGVCVWCVCVCVCV